jgi:hypothetical protein
MRKLSDLAAVMNYAEREIRQLIGMEVRTEYVDAFVCSRFLDICREKHDSSTWAYLVMVPSRAHRSDLPNPRRGQFVVST